MVIKGVLCWQAHKSQALSQKRKKMTNENVCHSPSKFLILNEYCLPPSSIYSSVWKLPRGHAMQFAFQIYIWLRPRRSDYLLGLDLFKHFCALPLHCKSACNLQGTFLCPTLHDYIYIYIYVSTALLHQH